GEPAHARDITAGPIEATYVALLNRIAASREHNGNGLGCRHGSQYRSTTSGRGDHVDPAAGQISRKGRQSIVLVVCNTVLDRRVAGLDIAGFTQAASERGGEVRPVISAERVQEPNHAWPAAARARRVATQPRRRAWLRIFVVRYGLPCDPPVG